MRQTEIEIPGAQPDVAGLLKRKAAEPIKPRVAQRSCDVGLFSDNAAQIDLVDLLAGKMER
jgi:transcriptional regulator